MKIAGMVTLYNPEKEVNENIKSYLSSLDKLYVIDNSSTDKAKKILPDSKKIKYIPNLENLGIATALNMACKIAIQDGYKYLLTMDQDSKFKEKELGMMIEYIEKNDMEQIGIVTPWHVVNNGVKKPIDKIDFPFEVMTSGNILNLSLYSNIGGFKDELFIDDVDIEYCMNLQSHDYKIVRLNYVELNHHLGDIEVKHILNRDFVCSNHNHIRRYYMTRNTFYLYDMYHDNYLEYCKFLKRGLRGQLMNIILFEKNKIKKVRYMIKGYKDYKKGIMGKLNIM